MAQISAQQAEDVSESAHRRIPDLVLDEDEEPVTEEDMQAAEAGIPEWSHMRAEA